MIFLWNEKETMQVGKSETKHVVMYDVKKATNNSAKAMVLREISPPPRRNRGPEDKCVYVLFPVSLKETLLIRSVT